MFLKKITFDECLTYLDHQSELDIVRETQTHSSVFLGGTCHISINSNAKTVEAEMTYYYLSSSQPQKTRIVYSKKLSSFSTDKETQKNLSNLQTSTICIPIILKKHT